MEERFCSECRAAIPKGESVCPACGVFAGDVFDGRLPRKRRAGWVWVAGVFVVAGLAGWMWLGYEPPKKTHLVYRVKLPLSERDAMQTLRRFLTTSERDVQCVALIGKGRSGDDYLISAVDRCKHAQLGQFAVDAKTAAVTKR